MNNKDIAYVPGYVCVALLLQYTLGLMYVIPSICEFVNSLSYPVTPHSLQGDPSVSGIC